MKRSKDEKTPLGSQDMMHDINTVEADDAANITGSGVAKGGVSRRSILSAAVGTAAGVATVIGLGAETVQAALGAGLPSSMGALP